MSWFREFLNEWTARRAGRKHLSNSSDEFSTAAREVSGRLGFGTTRLWDHVEESKKAYSESFDRKLPPSLHISERDRLRAGDPIPVTERRLEDWGNDTAPPNFTVADVVDGPNTSTEGAADLTDDDPPDPHR